MTTRLLPKKGIAHGIIGIPREHTGSQDHYQYALHSGRLKVCVISLRIKFHLSKKISAVIHHNKDRGYCLSQVKLQAQDKSSSQYPREIEHFKLS